LGQPSARCECYSDVISFCKIGMDIIRNLKQNAGLRHVQDIVELGFVCVRGVKRGTGYGLFRLTGLRARGRKYCVI